MNLFKFSFFLTLYLLCKTNVQSQSFIEGYNLLYKGDSLLYNGDCSKAIQSYSIGLDTFKKDRRPSDYMTKLAKLLFEDGYTSKSYLLYLNSIVEPIKLDYYKYLSIEDEFYKFIYNRLEFENIDSINQSMQFVAEYKNLVDSLFELDQFFIRKNHLITIEKNQNVKESFFINDSLIFSKLIDYIIFYGFPSDHKVGFESYTKAVVIILHNTRLNKNSIYDPIFERAYFEGLLFPNDYADFVDQRLLFSNKPSKFFMCNENWLNLDESQKKLIDAVREEFGICKSFHFSYRKMNNSFICDKIY
jgi:hypothetical protein